MFNRKKSKKRNRTFHAEEEEDGYMKKKHA